MFVQHATLLSGILSTFCLIEKLTTSVTELIYAYLDSNVSSKGNCTGTEGTHWFQWALDLPFRNETLWLDNKADEDASLCAYEAQWFVKTDLLF